MTVEQENKQGIRIVKCKLIMVIGGLKYLGLH